LKINLISKHHPEETSMAMNKMMFEEKWKVIRSQSTARWSLMGDFDLNKVDKANNKYDRFVTMLQIKYGYTRQQPVQKSTNSGWNTKQIVIIIYK